MHSSAQPQREVWHRAHSFQAMALAQLLLAECSVFGMARMRDVVQLWLAKGARHGTSRARGVACPGRMVWQGKGA